VKGTSVNIRYLEKMGREWVRWGIVEVLSTVSRKEKKEAFLERLTIEKTG